MQKIDRRVIFGAGAIMLAALLWSIDGIFLRPNFYALPPEVVVFLEHFFGLLVLSPWLIKKRRKVKLLSPKDWFSVFRVSFFGGLLGTLFITKAFFLAFAGSITFATVVILQKLQPVFALILARLFLKEKLQPIFYLWAIIAIVAGYVLAFGKDGLTLSSIDILHHGAFFSLLAAFAFGSSTVFGKRIVSHIDFEVTAALRFAVTSVLASILVVGMGTVPVISTLSGLQRGLLAVIVFTSGAAAMFLYYFGLQRVKASLATILELFWPVSAIGLDYFLNGNILTPLQFGATIVLLAMFFCIIRTQKKEKIQFTGHVIPGSGQGKKIGFPTANIAIDNVTLDLAHGVYEVVVEWKGKKYKGLLH